MKTRIRVKDGKYYPQHRFLYLWLNYTAYHVGYDSIVVFSDINQAKIFIDRKIEAASSEDYCIEYPKPIKMVQGGYQPKESSTGCSISPPPRRE